MARLFLELFGALVKMLEDYERHAAECRSMAKRAVGLPREQLLNMAATWEQLADTRRRKLLRLGKTEDDGSDLNC
jgi:hypothetical protein